jgi:D-alanyl-D-alanine carboxypeptidase
MVRILLTGILSAAVVLALLFSDNLSVRIRDFKVIGNKESRGIDMENKDWQLILVNSSNPLEENYKTKLKTVQNNHKVDERIAEFVLDMMDDAERDGVSLLICSSYRSVSRQQELFDDEVNKYVSAGSSMDEALAEAAYGVAVPGHSEHNTGLALDIVTPEYQILDSGFEKTDAFHWLNENAYKYGFILRYPKDKTDITKIKYEPWHYRFVGLENAERIKKEGICMEEYLAE